MMKTKMLTFSKQIVQKIVNGRANCTSFTSVRHFTMYMPDSSAELSNHASDIKIIDFRSDTTSLPTSEMRNAIHAAEVGDAVFNEDPTKTALERKSAELFKKEAAVFVTSGTLANLTALLVHCDKRGSEIITGSRSHIWLYEQAGAAQFGAISIREVENKPDGTFSILELQKKIRGKDFHEPKTSLICVENTHNVLGGKVLPMEWLKELRVFAKSAGLPLHMDGARIFNAAIKLGVPVSEIAQHVDTVSFCLSKGLGSPYGSVLVGPEDFIKRAVRVVKALGGGSRQIGFMAAAGSFALDHMVLRLAEDHENIQRIADVIREANNPYITVPPADEIHTNILFLKTDPSRITGDDLLRHLHTVSEKEERGIIIRAFSLDTETVRLVTCCNISKSDMEDALTKLRFVLNNLRI